LVTGVTCAGVTAAAIYLWQDVGQYRANLPPHATEGSRGFSLQLFPLLFTLCGVGIGVVAMALLVASCMKRRSAQLPLLTIPHVSTALSLGPLLYLALRIAGVFLR
jgi:hypothetical protein